MAHDHDDADGFIEVPICAACGVTAMPIGAFGTGFACDNDECEAFGELIPSE